MKLSSRLQTLANLIGKYKEGTILADIGSDHAYLPCYLIEKDIVEYCYACDINAGPVASAQDTVKENRMDDKITVLLGDGLDPIIDKRVDMIAIAGMGSYLITDILKQNRHYLENVKVLFLQPNSNIEYLRSYLFEHNYVIVDEAIVKDGGHIYEMVVAKMDCEKSSLYRSSKEKMEQNIEFGPVLSQVQSPLFIEKWNRQHQLYSDVVKGIDKSNPRYEQIKAKIRLIEEVLDENLYRD